MIDLVNAIANSYDCTVLSSNRDGIFPEDLARLNTPYDKLTAPLCTRASLERKAVAHAPRRLAQVALTLLEPVLMLLNVLLLMRLFRQQAPARVLICNGGYPGGQACIAAVIAGHFLGIDTWMSIASIPAQRRSHMQAYERALDRLVWRFCTRVVVNANAIESQLIDSRDMPVAKAVTIRNGIESLHPIARATKDDRITIGCVARMDELKGVLILAQAFIDLAAHRPNLRLILAGDGNASERLRQMLGNAGLLSRVDMLGHFSGDVHALLKDIDIFAFPSLWEGFPYSIVEAMRAGCAIVGTRVGGIPEAIENEIDGLLVEPGSVPELTAAIARIADAPDLREELAANARARFEREFSLEQMHCHARKVMMETK